MKTINVELHPVEYELIYRIRNEYQFGEIIIETRNGLPDRIGQKVVYKKLGQPGFDMDKMLGI